MPVSLLDDSEFFEYDLIECPHCSTVQARSPTFMGLLGRVAHYRCRYCGGGWSIDATKNQAGGSDAGTESI